MTRQSFANDAERTDVDRAMHPAMAGGDAIAQPAAATQPAHQIAARIVDVALVMTAVEISRAPSIEIVGEDAVGIVEERPVEKAAIGHQSPSKTGLRLAANAS